MHYSLFYSLEAKGKNNGAPKRRNVMGFIVCVALIYLFSPLYIWHGAVSLFISIVGAGVYSICTFPTEDRDPSFLTEAALNYCSSMIFLPGIK